MWTCVGYYNYRYFVLFLAYIFCLCLYALALLAVFMADLAPADRAFISLYSSLQTNIFFTRNFSSTAYSFSGAIAGLISSGLLLFWHLYLCVVNEVSIVPCHVTSTHCLVVSFCLHKCQYTLL